MEDLGKKKRSIKDKSKEDKTIDDFYPSPEDLKTLPRNSVLIQISFTLKKPYTSKDEGEFHIIDNKIFENPIVRDKFTGLPIVRPSTWKGHLRFAARKVEWNEVRKREIIRRLFGSEAEEGNELKGRLYFFPTFFNNNAEKDVITPLKRDTRTPARGPISLEVLKPGKKGEFYLLYLPYPRGEDFNENEVYEDLKFTVEALKLMFYIYGFSARKASGFGIIEEKLDKGEMFLNTGERKYFEKLDDLSQKIEELFGGRNVSD
ncbi:MAG: RAMP superfamily CRISPR-associated protein [Candidatus Nanoarchaeia archaeon]